MRWKIYARHSARPQRDLTRWRCPRRLPNRQCDGYGRLVSGTQGVIGEYVGVGSTLSSDRVETVLAELRETGKREDGPVKLRVHAREAELGTSLYGRERAVLGVNASFAITPEVGRLLYALALVARPALIVEFGASLARERDDISGKRAPRSRRGLDHHDRAAEGEGSALAFLRIGELRPDAGEVEKDVQAVERLDSGDRGREGGHDGKHLLVRLDCCVRSRWRSS